MKKIILCFLASFALVTALSQAKEPTNFAVYKQELIHYHDSGEYQKDINNVSNNALHYLQARLTQPLPQGKKSAIVLDIDETSLSNYSSMLAENFCGTSKEIRTAEDQGTDPAISSTLKLYRYAKDHQVAVFFITGREEEERDITSKNLQQVGYNKFDGLILRVGKYKNQTAARYKTAMRKELVQQGYDIIESVGDQESDLVGGYADKTFKLPNPYYFIP